MFGYLVRFGLTPKSVYRAALTNIHDTWWAWRFANANAEAKALQAGGPNEHVRIPGQADETPVDLIRKNRVETEFKNADFNRAWDPAVCHTVSALPTHPPLLEQ